MEFILFCLLTLVVVLTAFRFRKLSYWGIVFSLLLVLGYFLTDITIPLTLNFS